MKNPIEDIADLDTHYDNESGDARWGWPCCSFCAGKGYIWYDENHSKPCKHCCPHDKGWWELTPNFAEYIEGGDNRCCRAGCGMLYRDMSTE